MGSVLGLQCKTLRRGIVKRDGKGIYMWLVWAEMSLIDRGYGRYNRWLGEIGGYIGEI